MNRKTKVLIAGACAVAGFVAIRAFRGLKDAMEAVEVSPAAAEEKWPHSMEPVEAASEDSFPASDAPAWTGTTGPIA